MIAKEMDHHIIDLKDMFLDSASPESLKKGASDIVSKIRPQWTRHEYKIFNDGITNKLIGVYPSVSSISDMILVRVYGKGSEKLIDRQSELNFINILHSLDLSAPVYAIYGNGFAYGYSPGVTLSMESVKDPEIYPLIAKRLSHFHKIAVSSELSSTSKIWSRMRDMLKLISKSPHYANLEKEVQICHDYFTDLNEKYKKISHLNTIVFCHNDLLLGNIIYDESLKSIALIDFEYVFENYQWYDVANHFCEFVGLSESLDYEAHLPSEEFQKKWIVHYLNHMKLPTSKEDIHWAYLLVQKYMFLSHLFWGIWSYVQADISNIDFDFKGYGKRRIEEYYVQKTKVISKEF